MGVDRRDFLKTVAASSGYGLAFAAGLGGSAAEAAHHELAGTESGAALDELRDVIREIEASFHGKSWRVEGANGEAEARRFMLHTLQHGLEVWLEGDSARPVFKRFVTPEKKLLGDNPDAWYFNALVDPKYTYRIRGNTAGATYTSFTVEVGTAEGGMSRSVGGVLNDDQFETDADGNYEILVGATQQEGNWLKLVPGAGSISTRHYYEREVSIAGERLHNIPIVIERVDDPGHGLGRIACASLHRPGHAVGAPVDVVADGVELVAEPHLLEQRAGPRAALLGGDPREHQGQRGVLRPGLGDGHGGLSDRSIFLNG